MTFCHALVPLLCPFDCSHLNISVTFWVIQQVLNKPCHPYSSLYVPFMCCSRQRPWCYVHCYDFSYSTSKGLRRNMLFLCPLLVRLPCSFEGSKCFLFFLHKTRNIFMPQDLLNNIFPTFCSKWWEGFRLNTLYVFFCSPVHLIVPTSASRLLSGTASVEQAALSSLYVFLSRVALRGSCAKTGLDWSWW